jgi:hypothetical protein
MRHRAASEQVAGQVGRASGLSKWGGLLLVQHGEPAGRRPASEWCGSVVFYPPGAAGGVFRPFGPPCQSSWTSAALVEHVDRPMETVLRTLRTTIISGPEGVRVSFRVSSSTVHVAGVLPLGHGEEFSCEQLCGGGGDVLARPAASSMHRPSLSPRPIPFVLLSLSPSPPSTRSAGRPCKSVVPGALCLLWAIGGGRGSLMAGPCCGFG